LICVLTGLGAVTALIISLLILLIQACRSKTPGSSRRTLNAGSIIAALGKALEAGGRELSKSPDLKTDHAMTHNAKRLGDT
jgi:hypothetical protein